MISAAPCTASMSFSGAGPRTCSAAPRAATSGSGSFPSPTPSKITGRRWQPTRTASRARARSWPRALLIAGTPDEALEHYQWLAERWPGGPKCGSAWPRAGGSPGRATAERSLDALLAELPEHGEVLWERGAAGTRPRPRRRRGALPAPRRGCAPFDRRFQYSLYRCLLGLKRTEEAAQVNAQVAQIDADLRRLAKIRHEVMQRPKDADLRCEGGLIFLRNGEHRKRCAGSHWRCAFDPNCAAPRADCKNSRRRHDASPQMDKK